MPTFRVENATASTGGVFLLPFPAVDWFSWAILGAVTEMTNPDNWVGSSDEEIAYAVREASTMVANFKLLNFNPFPVGLVLPFAGGTPPDAFLLCDGGDYAIDDYPELFSVVAYTFGGAGDRFNVPSLSTRTVIGAGGGFSFAVGGGEIGHTLDTSEIPSHDHTIPLTATTLAVEPGEVTVLTPVPFFSQFTGDTGGGLSHNNMPPYLPLNYCIYAGRV